MPRLFIWPIANPSTLSSLSTAGISPFTAPLAIAASASFQTSARQNHSPSFTSRYLRFNLNLYAQRGHGDKSTAALIAPAAKSRQQPFGTSDSHPRTRD